MKISVLISTTLAFVGALSTTATTTAAEASPDADNEYDYSGDFPLDSYVDSLDFDAEDDGVDVVFDEVFGGAALENTCGKRCNKDRDCMKGGGFIQCGKCGLEGTRDAGRCIENNTQRCTGRHEINRGGRCVCEDGYSYVGRSRRCARDKPVGRNCGGQRQPTCRGRNEEVKCCPAPPRSGRGNFWRCVRSRSKRGGGCPRYFEQDSEDLEEISDSGDFDWNTDADSESVFGMAVLENSCGKRCTKDRDCVKGGGFIECGKCGLAGTRDAGRCIENNTQRCTDTEINRGGRCVCEDGYSYVGRTRRCARDKPVGRNCGGQRIPTCRGRNQEVKCCPAPPRSGEGNLWRCVRSRGKRGGECPRYFEEEIEFLNME